MSVKFLNQNITVNTVRPTGFKFPVGLSGKAALGLIDYLVVAGGGGGWVAAQSHHRHPGTASVRQDDARTPRRRRSAEAGRHRGIRRRRTCA